MKESKREMRVNRKEYMEDIMRKLDERKKTLFIRKIPLEVWSMSYVHKYTFYR